MLQVPKAGRRRCSAWVPSQHGRLESLRQWAGQSHEAHLCFPDFQGWLSFTASCPTSWVLSLHLLCTFFFICFKQEGTSSPCYSSFTRSRSLFLSPQHLVSQRYLINYLCLHSILTFGPWLCPTKGDNAISSNRVTYPNLQFYLFYCQIQKKRNKTIC